MDKKLLDSGQKGLILHEVMDRASIISHNFEVFIREALVKDEDMESVVYKDFVSNDLSELVDEISNKLFDLYQMLGNMQDE